jgi:hypothetical protein
MYLVIFLDMSEWKFNPSLHSTREAAEIEFKELVQRFEVKDQNGDGLCICDDHGEAPHLYRIQPDGKLGEEIFLNYVAAA